MDLTNISINQALTKAKANPRHHQLTKLAWWCLVALAYAAAGQIKIHAPTKVQTARLVYTPQKYTVIPLTSTYIFVCTTCHRCVPTAAPTRQQSHDSRPCRCFRCTAAFDALPLLVGSRPPPLRAHREGGPTWAQAGRRVRHLRCFYIGVCETALRVG